MDEPITLIDLSSYLGLTVTGGLLINLLLGLAIGTRVVNARWWKQQAWLVLSAIRSRFGRERLRKAGAMGGFGGDTREAVCFVTLAI